MCNRQGTLSVHVAVLPLAGVCGAIGVGEGTLAVVVAVAVSFAGVFHVVTAW